MVGAAGLSLGAVVLVVEQEAERMLERRGFAAGNKRLCVGVESGRVGSNVRMQTVLAKLGLHSWQTRCN